jgi:hypothetical protein
MIPMMVKLGVDFLQIGHSKNVFTFGPRENYSRRIPHHLSPLKIIQKTQLIPHQLSPLKNNSKNLSSMSRHTSILKNNSKNSRKPPLTTSLFSIEK